MALNVKLIHCYLLSSASACPSPSLNFNTKNVWNHFASFQVVCQSKHYRSLFRCKIESMHFVENWALLVTWQTYVVYLYSNCISQFFWLQLTLFVILEIVFISLILDHLPLKRRETQALIHLSWYFPKKQELQSLKIHFVVRVLKQDWLINYSGSPYATRVSYSGQVDGFRNPMQN